MLCILCIKKLCEIKCKLATCDKEYKRRSCLKTKSGWHDTILLSYKPNLFQTLVSFPHSKKVRLQCNTFWVCPLRKHKASMSLLLDRGLLKYFMSDWVNLRGIRPHKDSCLLNCNEHLQCWNFQLTIQIFSDIKL